jgi:hypothetical protein
LTKRPVVARKLEDAHPRDSRVEIAGTYLFQIGILITSHSTATPPLGTIHDITTVKANKKC